MSPQTQAEKQPQTNSTSKDRVAEDEVEEEIIEIPQRSIYDKIYELAEKFAATRIGQMVTEKGDGVLKVIEDTAKWSVPQKKSDVKLERPLPWIPFLSLIIWLRLARVWLSLGAIMIGNSPVSAADMVYFLQTRRRKLRAVRMQGAKTIRRREKEAISCRASNSNDKGLMGKLRKLMSRAVCRPGQHSGDTGRSIFMRQPEASDATSPSERQAAKRPRDDSCNDPNLTIDQMLQKYANEDSEDDSDYVPNPDDETNDDSSTINSSSSAISADEANNENPSDEEEKQSTKETVEQKPIKTETESTAESDDWGNSKQQSNPKAASNGIDQPQNEADKKQNHTTKAITSGNPSQNHHNSKQASGSQAASTNGHDDKPKSLTSNETSSSSSSSQSNKPFTSISTAMAGSPTDFSLCFLPQTISKPTNAMNSQSTPKSAEENTEIQSQTVTKNNRNSQRHNFYPNNRNRGRNHQRRHF